MWGNSRKSALVIVLLAVLTLCAAGCTRAVVEETVTVDARDEWSASTEMVLEPGTAFTVEVDPDASWTSGRWTGNADGTIKQWGDYALPGAAAYSLIGRIGDGEAFFVGTRYEGVAAARGPLELAMNDVPGIYMDNEGALPVRITVRAD